MTLNELTQAFLSAYQNHFRPHTHQAYGYDLGLFARAFPDLTAEEVTVPHLRAFLQYCAEKAPSPWTRRQATLKSCFSWGLRNDLIEADPR